MDENKKILLKKTISIISLIAIVALLVFLTYFIMTSVSEIRSAESFKEYVLSFGTKGVLVGFAFQMLQVFVAVIPGEVIEIGLGYAFGAILGTIICFAGLAAASAVVFLVVKKLGVKFVELFFSKEKLDSLKFVQNNVNNHERLTKITFIIFIIPGTPKDLFTYFLGLTPLTLSEFLTISMIARIPSVISSTIGGMLIHNGHYIAAVILFAVTALLSVAGWFCYDRYSKNKSMDN